MHPSGYLIYFHRNDFHATAIAFAYRVPNWAKTRLLQKGAHAFSTEIVITLALTPLRIHSGAVPFVPQRRVSVRH